MSEEGFVNRGGRPRHYNTPEEFDDAVNAYVDNCAIDGSPMTWTGLALALGFSSRQSIDEYLKYDGFSDSVKRAKALVENCYEKRLFSNANAGAIFALKNFGWSDKQEVAHTSPDGSFAPTRIVIEAATNEKQ